MTGLGLVLLTQAAWGVSYDFNCVGALQDAIDAVVYSGGGVVNIGCDDGTVWTETIRITEPSPVVIRVTDGTVFTLEPDSVGKAALDISGADVELSGFRLTCGDDGSERYESLIHAADSTLSLDHMVVDGCGENADSGLEGMALHASASAVAISHTLFFDNSGPGRGDAVACSDAESMLSISNSMFSTGIENSSQFINSQGCAVTLQNNVFQGLAGDDEPALSTLGGTATLTNNLFLNYNDVYDTDTSEPASLTAVDNVCDAVRACTSLPDSTVYAFHDLYLATIDDIFATDVDDDTCLAGTCLSTYVVWPTSESPLIGAGDGSHGDRENTDVGLTGGDAPWWPDLDGSGSGDQDSDNYPELYECDDHDDDVTMPETLFADEDGDGHGGDATASLCPDDGYERDDDCDDGDATIYPGADDVCDGIDNDCDAQVDEDLPVHTLYADADGDGFGDPNTPVDLCDDLAPDGYVAEGDDCDDGDASVGAGELNMYYADDDGDGQGAPDSAYFSCEAAAPEGYSDNARDCDDDDDEIYVGAEEHSDIGEDVDQNCDGEYNPRPITCGMPGSAGLSPVLVALCILAARRRPGVRVRRSASLLTLTAIPALASAQPWPPVEATASSESAEILEDVYAAERRCAFVKAIGLVDDVLARGELSTADQVRVARTRLRLVARARIEQGAFDLADESLGTLATRPDLTPEEGWWAAAQAQRVKAERRENLDDILTGRRAFRSYIAGRGAIAGLGEEPSCSIPVWARPDPRSAGAALALNAGPTRWSQTPEQDISSLPASAAGGLAFGLTVEGGLSPWRSTWVGGRARGKMSTFPSELDHVGLELGLGVMRGAWSVTAGPAIWGLPYVFEQRYAEDVDPAYERSRHLLLVPMGQVGLSLMPKRRPWTASMSSGYGGPSVGRIELGGDWGFGEAAPRLSMGMSGWWTSARVTLDEDPVMPAAVTDLGAAVELRVRWDQDLDGGVR